MWKNKIKYLLKSKIVHTLKMNDIKNLYIIWIYKVYSDIIIK